MFTKDLPFFVLKNEISGIEIVNETETSVVLKVGSGVEWHSFVRYTVESGWGGIENMSLIPGSVGASPMQNIGAYGAELKDTFVSLEALHIESLELHSFNKEQCQFGYRESVFKNELKDQFIITSVTFKLRKNPVFNTSYGAIEKELDSMGVTTPSIQSISKAVCNIRSSKLPDPKVKEEPFEELLEQLSEKDQESLKIKQNAVPKVIDDLTKRLMKLESYTGIQMRMPFEIYLH